MPAPASVPQLKFAPFVLENEKHQIENDNHPQSSAIQPPIHPAIEAIPIYDNDTRYFEILLGIVVTGFYTIKRVFRESRKLLAKWNQSIDMHRWINTDPSWMLHYHWTIRYRSGPIKPIRAFGCNMEECRVAGLSWRGSRRGPETIHQISPLIGNTGRISQRLRKHNPWPHGRFDYSRRNGFWISRWTDVGFEGRSCYQCDEETQPLSFARFNIKHRLIPIVSKHNSNGMQDWWREVQ